MKSLFECLFLFADINNVVDYGVNQASFGKQFDGDCRPQTPALRLFPPPDGGRRDTSSGRAWARRFFWHRIHLTFHPAFQLFSDEAYLPMMRERNLHNEIS